MTEATRAPSLRRLGPALPLLIFAVLAGLFWYALQGGDPSRLPSALIGKPVPDFNLPAIDGLIADGAAVPGFAAADLAQGEPTIVNVFASWCVECQVEHPLLLALSQEPGIRLYGIDYKDDMASARRFLGRYGNPYSRVGADPSGRVGDRFRRVWRAGDLRHRRRRQNRLPPCRPSDRGRHQGQDSAAAETAREPSAALTRLAPLGRGYLRGVVTIRLRVSRNSCRLAGGRLANSFWSAAVAPGWASRSALAPCGLSLMA